MFLKILSTSAVKKNKTNKQKKAHQLLTEQTLLERIFSLPPSWIKKHCYELPVQIWLWTKSKCFGVLGIQI